MAPTPRRSTTSRAARPPFLERTPPSRCCRRLQPRWRPRGAGPHRAAAPLRPATRARRIRSRSSSCAAAPRRDPRRTRPSAPARGCTRWVCRRVPSEPPPRRQVLPASRCTRTRSSRRSARCRGGARPPGSAPAAGSRPRRWRTPRYASPRAGSKVRCERAGRRESGSPPTSRRRAGDGAARRAVRARSTQGVVLPTRQRPDRRRRRPERTRGQAWLVFARYRQRSPVLD